MPFNDVATRAGTNALIPEEVMREIIQNVETKSVVMNYARRLPNMSRKQSRLPVLASLPQAYFVTGDTGRKQTTTVSWDNVFVNAEELAVLVPVPNAILDDADYDIWAEVQPLVETAIGVAFDKAVLYGINAPAAWPECIVEAAEAAGHEIALGQIGNLYQDLLGINGVLDRVERDGYNVTGHLASPGMKARFRGLVDNDNRPIFHSTLNAMGKAEYMLDGEPLQFPTNGALDASRSFLISGDWSQLVFSIRQDLTAEVFTSGVISDDAGAVVFNAMQQDSAILRVVTRLGWALPNPINNVNTNAATRYPFAFLEPVAAS